MTANIKTARSSHWSSTALTAPRSTRPAQTANAISRRMLYSVSMRRALRKANCLEQVAPARQRRQPARSSSSSGCNCSMHALATDGRMKASAPAQLHEESARSGVGAGGVGGAMTGSQARPSSLASVARSSTGGAIQAGGVGGRVEGGAGGGGEAGAAASSAVPAPAPRPRRPRRPRRRDDGDGEGGGVTLSSQS